MITFSYNRDSILIEDAGNSMRLPIPDYKLFKQGVLNALKRGADLSTNYTILYNKRKLSIQYKPHLQKEFKNKTVIKTDQPSAFMELLKKQIDKHGG